MVVYSLCVKVLCQVKGQNSSLVYVFMCNEQCMQYHLILVVVCSMLFIKYREGNSCNCNVIFSALYFIVILNFSYVCGISVTKYLDIQVYLNCFAVRKFCQPIFATLTRVVCFLYACAAAVLYLSVLPVCRYLFRLYWLPLKVLHSTGYSSMIRHQQTNHLPFYLFFNIMLWILQGMNIYWFMVRENCFLFSP